EMQLADAASAANQTAEQQQKLQVSLEEESRQKEEQRQLAASYQEQCASLVQQLQALKEAGDSAAQIQEEATRVSAEKDMLT
ncbi:unnamed protein product, partial [Symbiodinium pilosum]